jgi:hypothetical protein
MKHALPPLLLLTALVFALGGVGCLKSKPAPTEDAGSTAAPIVSATATTNSNVFNVQQCESLVVDAERKLADARNKAATDCKKDDECQLIETSACVPACSDRAVAKKAVTAYAKERDMLRMSSCKLWNDAECARTTPKPTPQCLTMKAVCKANKCEAVPAQ